MNIASPYGKHLRNCKKQFIERSAMNIITSETRNPTPNRNVDWQATIGDYDEGAAVGYGATPELATKDLLEQVNSND